MSVLDDFGDLMPHLVVISPLVSRDDYGAPTFGPPVTVPGRMVYKNKLVRGADGQETVSGSFVRIPPVTGLDENSQVVVEGEEQHIIAIEHMTDETNRDYYALIRFE